MKHCFGLALNAAHGAILVEAAETHGIGMLSALAPLPQGMLSVSTADLDSVAPHALTIQAQLQQPLPELEPSAMLAFLHPTPPTLSAWMMRNALLMCMTRSLVYVLDDLSMNTVDVVPHLLLARSMNVPSIGLLTRDTRTTLDSALLTYTDVVCGRLEPRLLVAMQESLSERPFRTG